MASQKMIFLKLWVLFDCSEHKISKKVHTKFLQLKITSYHTLLFSACSWRALIKLQTSLSSLSLMLAIWNFAHVLTVAVYIAWLSLKFRIEKFAKWWRQTSELYSAGLSYGVLGYSKLERSSARLRDRTRCNIARNIDSVSTKLCKQGNLIG